MQVDKDFENRIDWPLAAKYFAGETEKAESEKIENWLNEDAENMAAFASIKEAWESARIAKDAEELKIEDTLEKVNHRIELQDKERIVLKIEREYKSDRRKMVFRIAASVALFIGVAFVLHYFMVGKAVTNVELITLANQTRQVTLPDGSLITLNERTRLVYPSKFDPKTREVNLDGEAFFEVKRNEKVPFVINTKSSRIKVLGTSFNVNAYSGKPGVEVVVATGKVQMSDKQTGGNIILIEPGFKGDLETRSGNLEKSLNKDQNYLSWKTNCIVFRETNLVDVLQTLEKQYKAKFTLNVANTEYCRLTARFEKMPLNQVLEIIEATLNVKVDKKGDQYEISGKGCKQIGI
jgi:transmembrane sensor